MCRSVGCWYLFLFIAAVVIVYLLESADCGKFKIRSSCRLSRSSSVLPMNISCLCQCCVDGGLSSHFFQFCPTTAPILLCKARSLPPSRRRISSSGCACPMPLVAPHRS